MNKKEITEYREYLIENIRVNRIMFNELNEGDWEEDGYSSEEDMESMCKLYGDTTNILERSLETFDKIFGIDDTDDRVSFSNVEDAFDYYWDSSRNPNGNWETENALDEGELAFCVNKGFRYDDWVKCRDRKNEFPIGMKQVSSKESLNNLFNKNK